MRPGRLFVRDPCKGRETAVSLLKGERVATRAFEVGALGLTPPFRLQP